MTTATIKQRVSAEGHPFSEVFIVHNAKTFYSRDFYVINDTPMNRAAQVQLFLTRRERFPSGMARGDHDNGL